MELTPINRKIAWGWGGVKAQAPLLQEPDKQHSTRQLLASSKSAQFRFHRFVNCQKAKLSRNSMVDMQRRAGYLFTWYHTRPAGRNGRCIVNTVWKVDLQTNCLSKGCKEQLHNHCQQASMPPFVHVASMGFGGIVHGNFSSPVVQARKPTFIMSKNSDSAAGNGWHVTTFNR